MAAEAGAVAPIVVHDTLDSTNAEARRLAEAGERGPLWIMARHQTAGRGRRGRAWDGGSRNLTATLLLILDKPPIEAAQLAFVAGLAVVRMVDGYVSPAATGLKWPNDVLIDGRKVAGVLIESGPAPGGGVWMGVGIGVNLHDHPAQVERPAAAVADHLAPHLSGAPTPDEAIDRLAVAFAALQEQWLTAGFAAIRSAWLERAIGMGQACKANLPDKTLDGVAEGLDVDGALLLRLPGGERLRITAGDVFFGTS